MIAVERKEGRKLHPARAEFCIGVSVETTTIVLVDVLIENVTETHQVSTPNIGIPNSEKESACGIEKYM